MYRIVQREPEGWSKAFAIVLGDKTITHCSFRDTAEWLIKYLLEA
jgi:hypothetical protein